MPPTTSRHCHNQTDRHLRKHPSAMDQQSIPSATTAAPGCAPAASLPIMPLRSTASPCAMPPPVRMRRSSSSPGPRETLDSLPLPTFPFNFTASDNYTPVPQFGTPTAPDNVDYSRPATQDDRLYRWRGHSEDTIPRRQPDVATEGCDTASYKEPTVSDEALNQTPALASPRVHLDQSVEYLGSAISKLCLGRASGAPATRPFELPNSSEHPKLPLLGTCHGPAPRTHPVGSSNGYPTGNQVNNNGYSTGPGSDDDDGQSGQDDQDDDNGQSDDEPEEDGEGDRGGPGNRTNRRTQPARNNPLSCPYRKRNKARFNVRDHVKCTKPFRDFSILKYVTAVMPMASLMY